VIADKLRTLGHDVQALDERRDLEGIDDAEVLKLAAEEQRIVVTFNLRDFAPLLRQWAEEGKAHAGCILIAGIAQNQFGLVVDRVSEALRAWPRQEIWADRALVVSRAPGPK
jgi:Domain of unknown function (DUF5615)